MKLWAIFLSVVMATPAFADVGVYQIEPADVTGIAWRVNTQTGQAAFCSLHKEVACFSEAQVGDAADTGTYRIVPMVDFPAQAWRINSATGAVSVCKALEGMVTCSDVVDR